MSNSKLLKQRHEHIALYQVLDNYDPTYENKKVQYRKPSYQRTQRRSNAWCIALVDSVFKGFSIGTLHMSEWSNESSIYYHIEDGATRLDALLRFKNNEFACMYGTFDELTTEQTIEFRCYQLSVLMQQRYNNSVCFDAYFSALNHNFSLLQDGNPLNSNDRYCAHFPDSENNFHGSQLILYTLDLVNRRFSNFFGEKLRVSMCNRDKTKRKRTSDLVNFISAFLFGSQHGHGGFYKHVPLLENILDEEELAEGIQRLQIITDTIIVALTKYPRQNRERIYSIFGKLGKYVGSMLVDLEDRPDQSIDDFQSLWVFFINESRRKYNQGHKTWDNDEVYATLTMGQRRNNNRSDYRCRLHCIHAYVALNKHVTSETTKLEVIGEVQ